jgi:ribosome-binding protein aMBF1 (putative translation factor)
MAKTKDALTIIDQMIGDDADMRQTIAKETLNAQVARMIYEARTAAGLSQKELAERVGTKQPVIARLEDADYEGHSLSMLHRIAAALGKDLDIRFVPAHEQQQSA